AGARRPEDGGAAPPVRDGRPVEVTVGLYVLDFARVTAREESFDLTGYFELSWRDPRLVGRAVGKPMPGGVRRVEAGQIWAPRVFFHKALEPPRFHDPPVVEVDAKGVVTSWAIVSGKFSAPLDLRRFPFDCQVLPVRVGAFDDTSVVRFAANRDLLLVTEGAFVSDSTVDRPSAREHVPVGTRPGGVFPLPLRGDGLPQGNVLRLAGAGPTDTLGDRRGDNLLVRADEPPAPDQHVHGRADLAG